jgi:hypothetical protein
LFRILPHTEEKQGNAIIEDWLAERLSDKLRKATTVVQQTRKPRLLYRNTIEESKDALQEEVFGSWLYGSVQQILHS